MRVRSAILGLALGFFGSGAVRAADESLLLPAGGYAAAITPALSIAEAERVEAEMRQIPMLKSARVKIEDSTVHFTVKNHAQLQMFRMNEAVRRAAPGKILANPVLEGPPEPAPPGTPPAPVSPETSGKPQPLR